MRLMRLLVVLVNAAETHETFHWESGMRYQHSQRRPEHAWFGPSRRVWVVR